MNIYVWNNFSKRRNSTKQPTGGTLKTVYLKEETSIEQPSFILQEGISDYTYVQAFGKYYFVSDVISLDKNRTEIVCDLDVLATYKSEITSYTAFVERAASSYDAFINDPLLSQKQILLRETQNLTDVSSFFTNGAGCFLVECLAKDQGVVLYATANLEPYKFILSPGAYSAQNISEWVTSQISQSFDLDVYIGSVKWFPFTASGLGTALPSNSFPIGPVDLAAAAEASDPGSWTYTVYKVSQYYMSKYTDSITLSLPSTNNFGDFRDCNNLYTQYNLYLPGVGVVNMDAAVLGSVIHSNQTIYVEISVDLVSGEITYILHIGSGGPIIGRYSGNVSVDVPIGKSAVDTVKSAKMFAGTVAAGAAAGGGIGAAFGAVAGAVEAIYNHLTPDTSMVGGSGNKTEIFHNMNYLVLGRKQYAAKDYPTAVAGRPLMQNVLLSSLTGYVKCGNASVPLAGHEGDMAAVNNYLNSGFYIE